MLTTQADGRQPSQCPPSFPMEGLYIRAEGGVRSLCPFSGCAVPHRLDSFRYDSRDAVGSIRPTGRVLPKTSLKQQVPISPIFNNGGI